MVPFSKKKSEYFEDFNFLSWLVVISTISGKISDAKATCNCSRSCINLDVYEHACLKSFILNPRERHLKL